MLFLMKKRSTLYSGKCASEANSQHRIAPKLLKGLDWLPFTPQLPSTETASVLKAAHRQGGSELLRGHLTAGFERFGVNE